MKIFYAAAICGVFAGNGMLPAHAGTGAGNRTKVQDAQSRKAAIAHAVRVVSAKSLSEFDLGDINTALGTINTLKKGKSWEIIRERLSAHATRVIGASEMNSEDLQPSEQVALARDCLLLSDWGFGRHLQKELQSRADDTRDALFMRMAGMSNYVPVRELLDFARQMAVQLTEIPVKPAVTQEESPHVLEAQKFVDAHSKPSAHKVTADY
jgi:hypothetical protein